MLVFVVWAWVQSTTRYFLVAIVHATASFKNQAAELSTELSTDHLFCLTACVLADCIINEIALQMILNNFFILQLKTACHGRALEHLESFGIRIFMNGPAVR